MILLTIAIVTQPQLHPKYLTIKSVAGLYDQCLSEQSSSVCNCAASPFNYEPAGHVITGDLDIIWNVELKAALSKGPKYREPKTFTWRKNFKIIMDSVEDHARRWAKLEEADETTLSEWIKP